MFIFIIQPFQFSSYEHLLIWFDSPIGSTDISCKKINWVFEAMSRWAKERFRKCNFLVLILLLPKAECLRFLECSKIIPNIDIHTKCLAITNNMYQKFVGLLQINVSNVCIWILTSQSNEDTQTKDSF